MASAILARYRLAFRDLLIQLALVGVAWYFLGLAWELVAGIAVCILGGPLFPPRFAWLATLVGFGGLAALAHFYFHNDRVALVLGVVGVLMAGWSLMDSKGPRAAATTPPQ